LGDRLRYKCPECGKDTSEYRFSEEFKGYNVPKEIIESLEKSKLPAFQYLKCTNCKKLWILHGERITEI
jgi:ribosomal protein L44E